MQHELSHSCIENCVLSFIFFLLFIDLYVLRFVTMNILFINTIMLVYKVKVKLLINIS